jgi:hypothetical protein
MRKTRHDARHLTGYRQPLRDAEYRYRSDGDSVWFLKLKLENFLSIPWLITGIKFLKIKSFYDQQSSKDEIVKNKFFFKLRFLRIAWSDFCYWSVTAGSATFLAAAARLFGYDGDSLIGKSYFDIVFRVMWKLVRQDHLSIIEKKQEETVVSPIVSARRVGRQSVLDWIT